MKIGMEKVNNLLYSFMEPGDTNIANAKIPMAFVEQLLKTNERLALEKGHDDERSELVCRMLANNMSIQEVSLILRIRREEIAEIKKYNSKLIGNYTKTLKSRRKSQEKRED